MKRIVSMLLMLTTLIGVIPMFGSTASAATVLTISRPSDWQHISKNSPPTLKWSKISGAAGYTVTVKNDVTGKYYTQNEWTTSTSYSLADLFDEKLGSSEYPRLKIWVGAMKSTDISQGLISTDTQDSIIVVVAEKPDISVSTPTNITSDGATLKVTVNKNYGSDILDAGFYIGTSSTRSSATKYSLSEYGPSQVSNSGTMTMNITGLEPDTKYYCWGYAENYVDETVSSSYKTFWTEEDEDSSGPKFNQKPTLTLSIDGNKISGDIYGTYVPGDEIYLKFTANYSDHVFVETSNSQLTFTNPKGTVVSNGTFVEKTSSSTYTPKSYTNGNVFQVTVQVPEGIPKGDYTISVTATDGVYDGNNGSIDGTSYYTAVEKSVTVRIGKEPAHEIVSTNKSFDDIDDVKKIIEYTYSTDWSTIGKIAYVEQKFTSGNSNRYYTAYWGSLGGKSLCTRAASAMAMSYIGKTAFPKYIAPEKTVNGNIVYDESIGVDTPYTDYANKFSCDVESYSSPTLNDFVKMYNQYANDTTGKYSPIVIHTGRSGSPHAVLIIGKDPLQNNLYWTVDSGMNEVGIGKIKLAEVNGKLVVEEYYYYATSTGVFKLDTRYASSYSLYNPGIWRYVNAVNTPHTHDYSEYNYEAEHPHKSYKKCACGACEYTGETLTMANCNNCFPNSGNYYTQSELEAAVRNGELTDYNIYLAWYHSVFNAEGRDSQLKDYCDTLLYNSFAELYEEEVVRTWLMKVWAKCGNLTEKEFYSSLLYTLLAGQTESSNNSFFEVYESEEVSAGKLIFSIASEVTGIQYDKLSDAFEAIKQAAGTSPAKISEAYKEVAKLAPYKKFFEGLSDTVGVFDYMVTLSQNEKDFQKRVSHIMKITEASEKLKNILYEMSIDGSNHDYIQLAAYDLYCAMCEEDYSRRLEQVLKTEAQKQAGYAAKDALLIVVDDIIGSVVPGVALGMSAVDLLFDMSGEGESIAVMIMLGEMSDAIFHAAEKIRVKFVNTPSSDNARDYIVTMDLCHRFMFLTCEYTEDHLYDVFKSGIAKELIKNQDIYTTYMTNLRDSRAKIIEKYDVFYSTPQDLFNTCLAQLNTRYKITYSANGGTTTPIAQYNTVGATVLTTQIPSRQGYSFIGWAENAQSSTAQYIRGGVLPETKDGNITLYAVWQMNAVHVHSYEKTNYEAAHPHKVYTECECGAFGAYTGETRRVSDCTECYPKTYTITYDYDYDGGSVTTATKTHGQTYTISSTVPTRPSTETSTTVTTYTFDGWLSLGSASKTYNPGDSYTENSDLYLVAQWSSNVTNKPSSSYEKYSIAYDANNGINAPSESEAVTAGTVVTLSRSIPTRSGYIFIGWALDKNAINASYQPGDSYTVTGATTLYAVWKKQSSEGGSSGGEGNQTYIISGEITSYTSSGNYTIILYDANGEEYSVMVSRTPDYEFEVTPGRYTLEVSKAKHCTREYGVVVTDSNVTLNVEIWLSGNFDNDEKLDMKDVVYFMNWINFSWTGNYPMLYEGNKDFNKDGSVDMEDVVYFMNWVNFSWTGNYDINW